MTDENVKKPYDQLQIGDEVLYVPEGVFTNIEGYVWSESAGRLPSISAYILSAGITVPRSALMRAIEWERAEYRKIQVGVGSAGRSDRGKYPSSNKSA